MSLLITPHSITGATILEVWHDGKFIATVTGSDGTGVRVVTKDPMQVIHVEGAPKEVAVRVGDGKQA